jgi:hypothetical protein
MFTAVVPKPFPLGFGCRIARIFDAVGGKICRKDVRKKILNRLLTYTDVHKGSQYGNTTAEPVCSRLSEMRKEKRVMKNKLLMLPIAAAMTILMTACGSKTSDSSVNETVTSTEQTMETSEDGIMDDAKDLVSDVADDGRDIVSDVADDGRDIVSDVADDGRDIVSDVADDGRDSMDSHS